MPDRIYTKRGDQGQTDLFAGGRVAKDHLRVDAYGDVDELNALLGVVRHGLADAQLNAALQRVQGELFCVGADLATPLDAHTSWVVRATPAMAAQLEREIDAWDAELTPLKNFILPGGTATGAALHLARTVCRRAERRVVSLAHAVQLNPDVLTYLNRLSDWLFTAARIANHRGNTAEEPWHSPPAQDQQPG